MLIKRKLCVIVVIAAIVFLMLATQTMHRRHFSLVLGGQSFTEESVREEDDIPKVRLPGNKSIEADDMYEEDHLEETLEKKMAEDDGVQTKTTKTTEKKDSSRPCSCEKSCVSEVQGHEWFGKHFDPDQDPVVRKNVAFDPDALKWWMALQRSGTDQTIYQVIEKMFSIISPPALEFKPVSSGCRSCAVVGNSGNLLGSGHGNLINSFSSIIRMNKAVTRGFEKDVGNRTSFHIMYPESAIDLQPGVGLVLLPFKLRDLEWLTSALSTGEIKTTYMRVKNLVKADKDKVLVVSPSFFKYVNDRWTEHHGRYPSTGMLALVYALHACDQVSVFGYGADKQGNWHHYWEQNRNAGAFRKTGVHSADYETQVIHQLAKDGKIDLHL